eukprot:5153739-Amphidinium_carterae.3
MVCYLRQRFRRYLPTNQPWFTGLEWERSGLMDQADTAATPSTEGVGLGATQALRKGSGSPSQA